MEDDILAMEVHEAHIPCLMSGANQIYVERCFLTSVMTEFASQEAIVKTL